MAGISSDSDSSDYDGTLDDDSEYSKLPKASHADDNAPNTETQHKGDQAETRIDELVKNFEPYAKCKPCNKHFGGPQAYLQHLKGRKHNKKVAQTKLLYRLMDEDHKVIETVNLADQLVVDDKHRVESAVPAAVFECGICDKLLTGVECWFQHLVSKTHEKAMMQAGLLGEMMKSEEWSRFLEVDDEQLVCKLCHMAFSGPETAKAHMNSRGHESKLKNKELKEQQRRSLATESKQLSEDPNSMKQPSPDSVTSNEGEITKHCEEGNQENQNLPSNESPSLGKDTVSQDIVIHPKQVESSTAEPIDDALDPKKVKSESKNINTVQTEKPAAGENYSSQTQGSKDENKKETLYGYEKYKIYKKLMEEARSVTES